MPGQKGDTASPLTVFYSYAYEDEPLLDELEKHLSLLQRQGVITGWGKRNIIPGEERVHTIDKTLKTASIILLLISPDFIASDYCFSSEMQLALERNEKGLAHVIPILLRPVDWQDAPFSHLQYLPSNKLPVTLWESRDAAFLDVVIGIRRVVARIIGQELQSVSRPSSSISRQNRQRLLKRVRSFWIQGMLDQSLYQAALIVLGLQEQPDALANPWSLIVQETDRPARPLPAGIHITQVYDDSDGELLILGEPGSGKTTLLLELARDLLDRAERDEAHPMPMVFNLSSWAVKRQPLANWLAEELNLKYQVPSQIAKSWVSTDSILPLLDGLDEVAPTHRVACLEAINTYRREHVLVPLVVCSRSKEYFSQTTRMLMHNAVTVQPLTVQQIDEYLMSAGEQLIALQTVLHHDAALLELATNPLILNVLTLTYHGKTVEELITTGSSEVRRRQIFANYVQRMFEHRGATVPYTSQQTIHWLGWLASQMALHNQTEFYLESMQPDWLWGKRARRYYEWTVGRPIVYIFYGLLHAVYSGLLAVLVAIIVTTIYVGISNVLLGALIGVFPAGVLIGLVSGIVYGLRKGLYTAIIGIPIGALVGILLGEITSGLNRPTMGLIVGLVTGMMIGLLASIIGGKAYTEIYAAPVIGWSWEEVGRAIKEEKTAQAGLVIGGIGSLVVGAAVTVEKGAFSGLAMGWVTLLGGLFLFVLFGGMQSKALSMHVLIVPNQGIQLSARKGLYFCLALGLSTFIGTWVVISIVAGSAMGWICGLVTGFLFGIVGGWFDGWDACVRHLVLRVLLWRAGSIPRNYAYFLDYAVERILLRKIGGGYIFIHRLLLEYFALLTIAETHTVRSQTTDPDVNDATIYHNQGLILAEFSEYQQAILNYTRAIELNPKEVSVFFDRAVAYYRCKEYQQATTDLNQAIELEPKNSWFYRQRGFVYRDLKEYEKAIQDYTHAIRLEPESAINYGYRGWVYFCSKESEKAIADYTRAIELAPLIAGLWSDRSLIYSNLEDYEKAIADLTKAIELDPQETWSYFNRGKVYIKLKKYEKAIADFTQAIRLEPEKAVIYAFRGWVYGLNKNYQRDLTDITYAIELDSEVAWFYRDRGSVYMRLEEYEKAIADFTSAIGLEPSRASLYSVRGSAYLDLNAYVQAIEDFTHAIDLDAKYGNTYFNRGYAYLWLKKYELAHADFLQHATLKPGSVKAAWMVFYAHLGKQRPSSENAESLEKIVEIDPQSEDAQICQGVALGLRNNYNDGIAALEQSIQVLKPARDAYFWKGMFCAYLGRNVEAIEALTHALDAGLPPALLTPLYWLEQERPEFFQTYALPLLVQYGV